MGTHITQEELDALNRADRTELHRLARAPGQFVLMADGTLYGWDAGERCCYELVKRRISPSEMPEAAVLALMEKISSNGGGAQ